MEQSFKQVVEIVANLDDASPEVIGHAVEALLAEGALDVWTTAIGMKRGRPGVMISLLSCEDQRERLTHRLIELTGTFGARYRVWERCVLDREHETVQTAYGPIRIKVGRADGRIIVRKPEFADARSAAEKHGVAVRAVLEAAGRAMNQA